MWNLQMEPEIVFSLPTPEPSSSSDDEDEGMDHNEVLLHQPSLSIDDDDDNNHPPQLPWNHGNDGGMRLRFENSSYVEATVF